MELKLLRNVLVYLLPYMKQLQSGTRLWGRERWAGLLARAYINEQLPNGQYTHTTRVFLPRRLGKANHSERKDLLAKVVLRDALEECVCCASLRRTVRRVRAAALPEEA